MPITAAVPIQVVEQETFHKVDTQVRGLAFGIHNELGRFLDERLYKCDLTRRCRASGLTVDPEMWIAVSCGGFFKQYFVDHLINHGVIIESKTAAALCSAHVGQTLNYLFMCGLHHGTLLNFRTERVQHRFVSTRIRPTDRFRLEILDHHWKPVTERCKSLVEILRMLLAEWGGFLDPILYREGLTYFLGGDKEVVREVPVKTGDDCLGHQKTHLVAEDVAFGVTASVHRPDLVEDHQRRFLQHTSLRALHWINFNRHQIELRTIER